MEGGKHHSLALTHDGIVLACGSNMHGELGIGSQSHSHTFSPITEMQHIQIVQIAAGDAHSAALSRHNDLFIWGSGVFGEFAIPHTVKTIKGKCVRISLGGKFGAAVTNKGVIYTWGDNTEGQLGIGDIQSRMTPFPVLSL